MFYSLAFCAVNMKILFIWFDDFFNVPINYKFLIQSFFLKSKSKILKVLHANRNSLEILFANHCKLVTINNFVIRIFYKVFSTNQNFFKLKISKHWINIRDFSFGKIVTISSLSWRSFRCKITFVCFEKIFFETSRIKKIFWNAQTRTVGADNNVFRLMFKIVLNVNVF